MADFVNAVVETDSTTILDNAIDGINVNLAANGLPDWSPSDADLAVIALGIIAQIAADIAGVASVVMPAIFRAFGTQLAGIPYSDGTYATVSSTWTFTAPAPAGGYTIDAGTAVIVSGSAFYVQNTVVTNAGDTSATVLLIANEVGESYNGLGGVNQQVQPNDQIDWVQSIFVAGLTSGGADQETDDDYDSKLADLLTLQRISIVNAQDYPIALESDICEQVTGVAVGRATAIDGYYPAPRVLSTGGTGSTSQTCTLTSSSPTVTINTPLTNQVPHIGATVTGTGIPAGTTVAATPAPTPSSFTLSANATSSGSQSLTISQLDGYGPASLTCLASFSSGGTAITITTGPYQGAIPYPGATVTGTGIPAGATVASSPTPTATSFSIAGGTASSNQTGTTLTISAWSNVGRAVTSFVTDLNGNALTAVSMDALAAWALTYREANSLPFVMPPSYSTIYVSPTIHVLSTYNAVAVTANVQSAVVAYLNPAVWGNPDAASTGGTTWLNSGDGFNVVRLNSLIGVVENVPGVAYVPTGGLTLGFSASPVGTSDLVMPGPAPLPLTQASYINVTAV